MRVWLLKISEPLPLDSAVNKGRTAMLAGALAARGHEVTWWISSFDHQRKRVILPDDAEVQLAGGVLAKALQGIPYRKNFSLRRYIDHRLMARKFRQRAAQIQPPDVIVASMPDHHLAWEAVAFARERNIPVLVDIRDPWPDVFLDHVPPPVRLLFKTALFHDFRTLSKALRGADAILSTVSDWLEWGLAKADRGGTWKDRVFLIGVPRQAAGREKPPPGRLAPVLEHLRDRFVVSFIGTFNRNYEPRVVAEAAMLLRQRQNLNGRVAFLLAGDGDYFARLRKRTQHLDNVFFPGWVNREEMEAIHAVSAVGVVPSLLPTPAFPNKASGYLSAGLPVLCSNDGDLPRMLSAYQAGFRFERGNSRQLADLIHRLAEEPELLATMSRNARRLFDEKLDAERVYSSFADHVEAVAGRRPASAPGDLDFKAKVAAG
ncbi:MAG: glycosyltransferase family 4 protein [Acidobacteriota bacterium]